VIVESCAYASYIVAMTDTDFLQALRAELKPIRDELTAMDARLRRIEASVDGIPLISRKLAVVDQRTRALQAAFNDFTLTNPTTGEIEALHSDVNTVQAENSDLEHRILTLERKVEELEKPD
jgi:predicted  nucleic acid-binding Zn-ribbon protein